MRLFILNSRERKEKFEGVFWEPVIVAYLKLQSEAFAGLKSLGRQHAGLGILKEQELYHIMPK
jgi:hypothetical protein